MPDENEVYQQWLNAPEEERPDIETKLANKVKRHAQAVVWQMLGEDRPDLVEDITAAVMVEIGQFRHECKFSTWVQEIAQRKSLEERRKLGRERKVFDKNVEVVTDPHLEAEVDFGSAEVVPAVAPHSEEAIAFELFLAALPEEDAALLRYKREGLKSREIAERMGSTVEAVDSRWARLKPRVMKEFRPK